MPHSSVSFDGYKFFTGPNNECKFQLVDKSFLPDNDTKASQVARDLAGAGEISSCVADNSDVAGNGQPRRSTALLKLHAHPFERNASGWRYFSMMIRNPQATPVRSTTDGRLANAFQIVMKTLNGETVADMSFQALDIKTIWVCGYTEWFLTTPCTANCGGGFRTRVRRMLHANPEGYDRRLLKNCHESLEEHETCNTQECDVDCQLSEWTPWANGECSRSCGGGTMVERRNVVMGPKGHGLICPPWSSDARVRVVPCNMNPCNASCIPSELEDEYKPFVKDFLVFKDVPTTDGEEDAQSDALDQSEAPSESKAVPKEAQGNSGEDTTDSNEQSSAQENSGTADKENNIGAVTEENEASNEDQPDTLL